VSVTTFNRRLPRAGAGLLAAVLAAGLVSVYPSAPGLAAAPSVRAAVPSVVAEPTNLADAEQKVKAAGVLGINAGVDLLVLDDQAFVLAMWRAAGAGTHVKAAALRTYEDNAADAAYVFITAGIFAAAQDDALAEIAAEHAKARRRSVAVTVGLDPRETALIEKSDRDFIFSIWQRAAADSHVRSAAGTAIADGSTQADWDAFLNTGAQAAAAQDMRDAIDRADAEQAARLRAQQLATAKRSLLQLLLLPVTEELINAPDRQYVLAVHNQAKGAEVQLASQAALNAPDAELAKALTDFIFTGGAAANALDEKAAAAKELAGYRVKVEAIRDAARLDGWLPNLAAEADRALTANTLLALQTFLLKGQDAARVLDRKSWASVVLSGDRIGVLNTETNSYAKAGSLSAGWVDQRGGVKQLAMSGTRVGVLSTDGIAYVKEGGLAATWVTVHTGIKQLVLAGDRIGVVTTGGIAYVKDGSLSAGWVTMHTNVKQLALAGERVGVLRTDGTAYVKEGALNTAWVTEHTGMKQLALSGDRIGVLSTAGTVYVKAGSLSAGWVTMHTGMKQLALAGDRVGVLSTDGIAYVKEGGLSTAWATEHSDVRQLALDGKRIGVLRSDGIVWVKEGSLGAAWVNELNVGSLT
jgi:hypothetical protein